MIDHRFFRPKFRLMVCAAISAALIVSPLSLFAQTLPSLPDLGDVSQKLLTPSQERKIGEGIMTQMRADGVYMNDPEVNDYLDLLGHRLVAADKDTRQPFDFFAINDNTVNAFALPGGFIGVNTGLILLTQNESELASVLTHEITHVTQHHLTRSLSGQSDALLILLAAMAAGVAAAASKNGQLASAAIAAGQAGAMQSELNYTREHEFEADRIGFTRLIKAGFDPQAQAALMSRMLRATRYNDGTMPSYLRTHPVTTDRISEAKARAERLPYKQVVDSLDFHFVRALLQSYQDTPREAVAFFEHQLAERKFNNEVATHYGLVAALFRTKDYPRAKKEIAWLDERAHHPMIDAIAARVLMENGDLDEALARLSDALKKYPNKKQLVYDYPECLMRAKKDAEAADFLERAISRFPDDGQLHQLASQAYAHMKRPFKEHQHLGEYYLWMGSPKAAADQFSIALKEKDGTFQEQSAVESLLRDIREVLAEQPGKKP